MHADKLPANLPTTLILKQHTVTVWQTHCARAVLEKEGPANAHPDTCPKWTLQQHTQRNMLRKEGTDGARPGTFPEGPSSHAHSDTHVSKQGTDNAHPDARLNKEGSSKQLLNQQGISPPSSNTHPHARPERKALGTNNDSQRHSLKQMRTILYRPSKKAGLFRTGLKALGKANPPTMLTFKHCLSV